MKDRHGKQIKCGDIVARRNGNLTTYPEVAYQVNVVKRGKGRDPGGNPMRGRLILDNANGWSFLSDTDPMELVKLDGNSDMRKISHAFRRDLQRPEFAREKFNEAMVVLVCGRQPEPAGIPVHLL